MSTVSRGNKGEDRVINTLKKIKVNHWLMNNFTYVNETSELSHQIDHILIHPHGVFVIETKNYYGQIISNTGDSFWLKITKGETTKISNPLKQNKSHTSIVRKLLNKEYEVISVVVFVKNNAPYMDDENVINLKDLLLFIDSYPYKKLLTDEDIKKIHKTLVANKSKITKKEHLANIGLLKQAREEIQDEITYALENNKCPSCGGAIIRNNNKFRCEKCNFKFNL